MSKFKISYPSGATLIDPNQPHLKALKQFNKIILTPKRNKFYPTPRGRVSSFSGI